MKPFTDKLKDYSLDQLKTAYQVENILRNGEFKIMNVKVGFGDTYDTVVDVVKSTHSFGTYTWESYQHSMKITVTPDWYDEVYLEGIGTVRYMNRTSLVLAAEKIDNDLLREDLRMDGFQCYKVKLPVFKEIYQPVQRGSYSGRWRTIETTIEERFMVASVFGDNDSMNYAAVHLNAAGANLKKAMMKKMSQIMGI